MDTSLRRSANKALNKIINPNTISKTIASAALLLMVNFAFAQFSIEGVIKDQKTGRTMADAQVYIKELNLLQDSNNKGQFSFQGIKKGSYHLVVFAFNYTSITEQIVVDQDLEFEFALQGLETELSEVVISQQKEEIFGLRRMLPVEGTAIYAGKKTEVILLDQMVGNKATNNARQVYAQVVGLNIFESNDGGLQLSIGGRGLDPNRSANFNTRQNGYDISPDVLGYPESYYTPPVEALEEIEVIRGAASLQYGTQFGGLVNFKMKSPVKDKPISLTSRQTSGSFGLFTSFNAISGTIGKFSYYSYYNYKKGNGYRPNSQFNSDNAFINLRYAFSERTKISLEYTYLHYLAQQAGGLTDQQFEENPLFSDRERNWFDVNWKLYNLKLDHKLSNKTDLSLNIFGLNASRFSVGYRGAPGEDGINRNPVLERDHQKENGEYEYQRDLIKGYFQNWGAEIRSLTRYKIKEKDLVLLLGSKIYNANNRSAQGTGTIGSDADFSFADNPNLYGYGSDLNFPNFNWAVFGENLFYVNDKLSITPGFRFEYIKTQTNGSYVSNGVENQDDRVFDRKFFLLGVGINYEWSENMELYANLSQNYRSVTFSDIRTVNPSFVVDPDLTDEKGFNLDLGVRGKKNKTLSYEMDVYALLYQNRIGIIFDNRANRVRSNIGDALIYGVELLMDWNILAAEQYKNYQLKYFVNSAFTDSYYFNSIEGNVGVDGKSIEFVPAVNLKTGLSAGYKNLLASIQYTYLSQQFTDAENNPSAENSDARAGVIGTIPAYDIMDLSLSYKWKYLRLETGITNLTNNNYFTRRATGYPGPGIIPSDGRGYYVTLGLRF